MEKQEFSNSHTFHSESEKVEIIKRAHVSSGTKVFLWQLMIFMLTYLSYAFLHGVREGWSILKTDVERDEDPGLHWQHTNKTGIIDFFFLLSYSFGLFISGVLGDNYPIRIILPVGYLIVSAMTIMISYGGTWRIRNVVYYLLFFSISGLGQSIGWPTCIAVMGNWFSQESRGLIFGIWCTCQNMGNIGGNILANFMRDDLNMTWMTALRTIGICIGGLGVINFLLLIEHPHKVGIVVELTDEVRLLNIESICEDIQKRKSYVNKTHHDHHDEQKIQNEERNINLHSIQHKEDHTEEEKEVHDNGYKDLHSKNTNYLQLEENIHEDGKEHAISFWKAWLIPGVIPYALSLAGVKCSTYGILFWLPSYADQELNYSHSATELIVLMYDIGGIIGSIALGKTSDMLKKKRAPVAFVGLLIGSFGLVLVIFMHNSSKYILYVIIFFVGFFVGGILNIVAATAAADIAKGESLKGNDKALGTVSGILDGSGSLGAAFGTLVIGRIREVSWNGVFIFISIAVFVSAIPITKLFITETREIINTNNSIQKKGKVSN